MYVGNTESIHKVFELAKKEYTMHIIFDEVDAIGGRRRTGRPAVHENGRKPNAYELDGVETNNQMYNNYLLNAP